MKIGILTQPLRSNYGGLLQAYALQEVLKRMGHEPWILQREKIGRITSFLHKIKEWICSLIGREYVSYSESLLAYLQQKKDNNVIFDFSLLLLLLDIDLKNLCILYYSNLDY